MKARQYTNLTLAFLAAYGVFSPSSACGTPLPDTDSPRITPTVKAVRKVLPSVVNISTRELVRVSDPFETFFEDFFRGPVKYYRQSIPLGSGLVIDPSGLIITNYHVVRRASNIEIMMQDDRTYRATLLAFDATNDLALLHVHGDFSGAGIRAVTFARPEDLLLGEPVVAVGNPFGLGSSVTTGVLSATNRSLREGEVVFNDILQTDAAINPGNSGGPLINLDGECIGLNLAIRRGAEGIGFALPISRVEQVLAPWLTPSQVSNSFLGLIPGTVVDGLETYVQVEQVLSDSPAADAGIEAGDRINAINGQPVTRALEAGRILWRLKDGAKVVLDLGPKGKTSVKVHKMPADQLITRRLRIKVQELTPALKEALGLPTRLEGVAISEVTSRELVQTGIRRGDIIYQVNNTPVKDKAALAAYLSKASPGTSLVLYHASLRTIRGMPYLDQFVTRVIVH